MAKRKREIQKRKKQQDSGSAHVHEAVDDSADGRLAEKRGPDEARHLDDSQIRASGEKAVKPAGHRPPAMADNWFSQNKENLLLGLLVLYVFLLGLGTAGELFEIEWILNLPLFK